MISQRKKWIFTSLTIILSTLLSLAFEQFNLRRENILLIYVASIMMIIVETKDIKLGVLSTFLLVFIFNFFFTEPKYTFIISDPNYIITLIIFMFAISILGTITTSLQKEVKTSRNNEKKIELLYKMSKALLTAHTKHGIIEVSKAYMKTIIDRKMFFYFRDNTYADQKNQFCDPYQFLKEIDYAIDNQIMCGFNELKHQHLDFKIFPIRSNKDIEGAFIVDCGTSDLSRQEKEFIQTGLLHMLTALEREKISDEEEKTRIEIEKERLKSALLRSISHDLRTPLTTLSSGTSFIHESYELLNDETKKGMLLDINNETTRLSEFVDNLLNLTRLNANQLILKQKNELVDDILTEVFLRLYKRLGSHKLQIENKNEFYSVYADTALLMQVFINIIDNAIKYTPDKTNISVKYEKIDKFIHFYISDEGGGIKHEHLESIFNDFVSMQATKSDRFKGIGLGLSISKAIVTAHGGKITAYNNSLGATFEFTIPCSKEMYKKGGESLKLDDMLK